MSATDSLKLDPARAALIIQDMQNDVIIEGGAFADSGAPAHAIAQGVVANVQVLAESFRAAGAPVIHVWYIVEPGAAASSSTPLCSPASKRPMRSFEGPGERRPRTASSHAKAITWSRRCG